jgi:hypothetical protein
MILRVAFRFIVGLVVATALVVALMAVLSPIRRAGAAPLSGQDHVTAVKDAVEAPADEGAGGSSTPRIVLVFAGIVLLAVLPPVHRVHVHHRSYQRFDWI